MSLSESHRRWRGAMLCPVGRLSVFRKGTAKTKKQSFFHRFNYVSFVRPLYPIQSMLKDARTHDSWHLMTPFPGSTQWLRLRAVFSLRVAVHEGRLVLQPWPCCSECSPHQCARSLHLGLPPQLAVWRFTPRFHDEALSMGSTNTGSCKHTYLHIFIYIYCITLLTLICFNLFLRTHWRHDLSLMSFHDFLHALPLKKTPSPCISTVDERHWYSWDPLKTTGMYVVCTAMYCHSMLKLWL